MQIFNEKKFSSFSLSFLFLSHSHSVDIFKHSTLLVVNLFKFLRENRILSSIFWIVKSWKNQLCYIVIFWLTSKMHMWFKQSLLIFVKKACFLFNESLQSVSLKFSKPPLLNRSDDQFEYFHVMSIADRFEPSRCFPSQFRSVLFFTQNLFSTLRISPLTFKHFFNFFLYHYRNFSFLIFISIFKVSIKRIFLLPN